MKKYYKEYQKQYRNESENKIYQKEYQKAYRNNSENYLRLKEYQKKYGKKYRNIPGIKVRNKVRSEEWRNRPEIKVKNKMKSKEWRNTPDVKIKNKKYQKVYMKDYINQKRKNDSCFRISCNLRSYLCQALKYYTKTGKIWSAKKYDISYDAIITHLTPFPEKLENYEVDHIIPVCLFDLNKSEHIKKVFLPENHQWLTKEQNLWKGSRLVAPCAFEN